MPDCQPAPLEQLLVGHQAVVPVLRVELRVLQQLVSGDVLLQDGEHEDWEGGVDGVVHHQEETVEDSIGTVVVEEHVEELSCAEGDVFVERILDEESRPEVVPVSVHQQGSLQEPELGEGKVRSLSSRAALMSDDAEPDVSLLQH